MIYDNIDADGLRDFILDYGAVLEFNEPHQLSDNYRLLGDDDINDIDDEIQHSITKLALPLLFGVISKLNSLDFSDYKFDQLEILVLGPHCMELFRSLCFTSIVFTLLFYLMIPRLAITKDNNSW